MSGEEEKPEMKRERKRGGRGGRGWRNHNATPSSPGGQRYKAPTAGLEDFVYDCGAPKDAANYLVVTEKICNHLQSTLKMGSDVARALRNLEPTVINYPDEPGVYDHAGNVVTPPTTIQEHRFKREYDAAHKREECYEENIKKAYAVCYEHCTPRLKALLKGDPEYNQIYADQDGVSLLKKIKARCCRFDATKQETRAIVGADKGIFLFTQKRGVTNDSYFEQFNALVDAAESYGSGLGYSPTLTDAELRKLGTTRENATDEQLATANASAKEAYLAMLMLDGAHESFRALKEELDGDYAKGTNTYPSDRNAVLRLLNQRSKTGSVLAWTPRNLQQARERDDGLVFAQAAGKKQDNRTCYRCGKKGHIATVCPEPLPDKKQDDEEQVHAVDNADTGDDGDGGEDSEDESFYFFWQCGNSEKSNNGLNRDWLLLDSQSSTDMFCNSEHVTNIRTAKSATYIRCNAGVKKITLEADFKFFDAKITVKFDPNGICNIISFKTMKKLYPIRYSSHPEDKGEANFEVHTKQGVAKFKPCEKGLHYLNICELKTKHDETVMALAEVTTIRKNYEGFTKREVEQAIQARKLQAMLGSPSQTDYEGMVRGKLIDHCPISITDIKNAHRIFGPDLAGIRGKTVRKTPERVEAEIVAVPRNLVESYKYCTLVADVMFVNGIPFLITRTRGLQLITIEYLPRRTAKYIGHKLNRVLSFYRRAGFVVQLALMDMEFETVRAECPSLPINTCAANEHVPEIERAIRLVKERARGVYNTLPFKDGIPRLMVIELIYFSVLWINAFPLRSGISNSYSPRELVTRQRLNAKLHCKTPFGTYCEVHDEPQPSNSMIARTHEAICMGPTGNYQGSYKFYCLKTKRKLIRRRWTEMPMPGSIIRRIHAHAALDKTLGRLTFRNRRDEPDEAGNEEYHNMGREGIVDDEPAPYPDIPAELPGIDTEGDGDDRALDGEGAVAERRAAENSVLIRHDHHQNDVDRQFEHEGEGDGSDEDIDAPDNIEPADVLHQPGNEDVEGNNEPAHDVGQSDGGQEDEIGVEDDDVNEEQLGRGCRQRRPNQFLRYPGEDLFAMYRTNGAETDVDAYMHERISAPDGNKIDSYLPAVFEFIILQYGTKAALHTAKHGTENEIKELMVRHCLSQYSLKAGLKKFGKQGEAAVRKELGQFHDLNVFIPVDAKKLTRKERQDALASLIFLKEKRDGTVKARACADGRKQRETTAEEEAASPTVSLESVFITCAIEAKERRDVAVMDLPGAFLHADCEDHVLMRFQGRLAELMEMVAPQIYRRYVVTDSRGESILFVKLQKALYGMLKSALLFYKKLAVDLVSHGFKINPYDPCVVTKDIQGKQMTICWHVDDLKISHENSNEVTKVGDWLKSIYGNVSISRGREHTYLGMQIKYTEKGCCEISMTPYTEEIINQFPEDVQLPASTPAADHLFKIRDATEPKSILPAAMASLYHRATAQLLFLSGRARRDIQVAVAFLTTRVKEPDDDDWGKLKRVLRYLSGTRSLPLTMSVDDISEVRWYVDASFAAHDDCKGHTGAMMTMGKGAKISFSRKQKINARSSTESELIGIYDALPSILHCRYFLESLGYGPKQNIVYQDNKSAISLEKNGKASSSKRTKHIRMRYFFIKDCVDRGEVIVKHCPTKEMWSDILTKPKQGKEFFLMRSKLMGCPVDITTPVNESRSKPTKEIATNIHTTQTSL